VLGVPLRRDQVALIAPTADALKFAAQYYGDAERVLVAD